MKEKETDIVDVYDGFVGFQEPVLITNDANETIPIYGLLYNRNRRHRDDLWTWELNRYLAYLQGCESVQKNKGKLVPEQWITSNDNIISLDVNNKNFIYRIMKHRLIEYKISENIVPFEIEKGDVDDVFVISQEFSIRNGLTPVIQISEI